MGCKFFYDICRNNFNSKFLKVILRLINGKLITIGSTFLKKSPNFLAKTLEAFFPIFFRSKTCQNEKLSGFFCSTFSC